MFMYDFIFNLRVVEDVKYYMLINKFKFFKFQMKNLKLDFLFLRVFILFLKMKLLCLKYMNLRILKIYGLVMYCDQGFF